MSVYDPPCLRSRSLLRVTLLKDQTLRDDFNRSTASLPTMLALATPPSTPTPAPRSPSSSPMRPTTRERQRATGSYAPMPRRPHTAQPTPARTRDHSRSPLSTPDHTKPHLVTPHEHVLRTRLERVLFSAGVVDDISKRERRGRSPSAGAGLTATSLNPSTRTIKRNRSKTESNVPPSHFSALPRTPHTHPLSSASRSESIVRQKKRTSTGRSIASGSGSGSASLSGSGSGKRSGTTPPLVLDDDDGSGEGGEPRILLLTPPSTPSPPALGLFQPGHWGYTSQYYRGEDDEDDDEDESCSSSYSSYREGSSISSSALRSSVVQHLHQHPPHTPINTPSSPQSRPSPRLPHTPTRPFNARRASAQCRAMEGYVSFANVEGLGVPPDESGGASPHASQGKGMLTALGWGGGVVRKILGGGEKAEDGVC